MSAAACAECDKIGEVCAKCFADATCLHCEKREIDPRYKDAGLCSKCFDAHDGYCEVVFDGSKNCNCSVAYRGDGFAEAFNEAIRGR